MKIIKSIIGIVCIKYLNNTSRWEQVHNHIATENVKQEMSFIVS